MPTSILEEVNDLLDVAGAQGHDWLPEYALRFTCPVDARPPAAGGDDGSAPQCSSCGASHVAQVLGDDGGISFVCTACGRSWS
ncbi:hypothetical protein SAMN05428945_3052 [Streptomyces sp. 2224.1]|uniref:hypothetical protein n=1 Tax=unclassified Streptomyces TaxID=2593676 RepID=UPI0008910E47|nr:MULTISPECIES: hypothetical protein [unclassified Streptomyces]PBC82368.1 hypothetical protein BX261_2260 [Streptomyces sp. 2321.6]SDR50023.1 hypothetical protein SAMN05216511_4946 [Streptomyces sp. KS_16]SEC49263.1 hypothetical protein SAMN05428945_3052 [Streptomyces sp. 2224.1]SEC54942.1 hypothetical protein SAMN05428940_2262 [Streptomyces sp. 2133.1]SEE98418.1 hypothetical protein SAMN05428954_5002 [Streptomyces sp. 2112.3]